MDFKPCDAGLHATGCTNLRRVFVSPELFPVDKLLLDVCGRIIFVLIGGEDFHWRQYQVATVSRYRMGDAGAVHRHVGYRKIARSKHYEPAEPGSSTGKTLSMDGTASLRLVLPSPGHFGAVRERDLPLHDNVGADNEIMVSDERRDSTISKSEQSFTSFNTIVGSDLCARLNRTYRGSGC